MILSTDHPRAVRPVRPLLAVLAAVLLLSGTPTNAHAAATCTTFTVYRTVTFLGIVVWQGVYEEGITCTYS
jgi:hypothetical protein